MEATGASRKASIFRTESGVVGNLGGKMGCWKVGDGFRLPVLVMAMVVGSGVAAASQAATRERCDSCCASQAAVAPLWV